MDLAVLLFGIGKIHKDWRMINAIDYDSSACSI